MPAKVYLSLPEHHGDFRAMPAYLTARAGDGAPALPAVAGVKWVNSHAQNPARFGLPAVMGLYVLSDPETALPLAVLDATLLTALRTGAAAAVSTKHLGPERPRSLGLVGCGVQARWMLAMHRALFGDELEVLAADLRPEAAAALASECGGRAVSVEQAAGADVVCCSTPARTPVVQAGWVKPGAHIAAMGADAPGKQELEVALLQEAVVVIDDYEQATHSGEINVPLSSGEYSAAQLFGTLGEVIAGAKRVSRTPETVTVFDSTGLAVQDVALARVLYAAALERGMGTRVELVA
jgi:ornithine cyclodeaminase/alanine dehydrogenase